MPGKGDESRFGEIFERLPEPSESYFAKYIQNSKKLKSDGDAYARHLDIVFASDYEHLFSELTELEIQELIIFIKTSSPNNPAG